MKYLSVVIAFIILLSVNSKCHSYDDEKVHPRINVSAANQSLLVTKNILQNIGLTNGLKTELSNSSGVFSVENWIARGGTDEDAPDRRAINHFHDPLQPWSHSGFYNLGYPALIWAQDQSAADNFPNQYSWAKARDHYYQALTTGTESEFADTFLALGHLMHLVSDMAVPAHVRQDYHVSDRVFLPNDPDLYEKYTASADVIPTLNFSGAKIGAAIFDQAPTTTEAPAPITALWDKDIYSGNNPGDTISTSQMEVGLAEYTNANFFSKDTFTGYPYPLAGPGTLQNTDWIYPEEVVAEDGKRDLRVYYWDSVGSSTIRKAGTSLITLDVMAKNTNPPWQIDDNVSRDYASLLVPAAVGYSTALLDYFFRGDICSLPTKPTSASRINSKEYC